MNNKIQYVRKRRLSYAAKTIYFRHKKITKSDLLENIDLYFNINEHLNKTLIEMVEIFDLIYMQNETFFEGKNVNSIVLVKNVLIEGGNIDIFPHIFTYLNSLQTESATKSCFRKHFFQKGHLKN